MSNRTRVIEALLPWTAGLLLGLPVLIAYYPPMTDLPFHEGAIGLLRHFSDASMCPPGLYRRNLGEPNQLFHMVGWALSYALSTRWAVKLVVFATVVAIPVSAARFARHVGASPLVALALAPMALGWLFSWGLIANLIGLAALLVALPTADRYAERPSARGLAASLALVVLLYFAHEAMMFVYAGAVLWLAVLRGGSWKRTALRLLPFVACVAVTLTQLWWQKRFMTPSVRGLPTVWHSLLHKLERVSYMVAPASDRVVQLAMSALCLLAIGSMYWLRTRERRSSGTGEQRSDVASADGSKLRQARGWALAHRWELFGLFGIVAYLAFPLTLNGATLVYQRWFPPSFAVLAVIAAPRDLWTRPALLTRWVLYLLPTATLLIVWPAFADSSQTHRDLAGLLPYVEPGSAMATLELGVAGPNRDFSLGPAGGRVLAARGGRLSYSFADSSVSPIVIPRRVQWQEPLTRIASDCWAFRPEHDLRLFRYVLVHTSDVTMKRLVTYSLLADARVVAEAGEWTLFESRLPVVPVVSAGVRMEEPPPESLRDRVRKVLTIVRDARQSSAPPPPPPADAQGSF